jgi:hypothetical protein
MTYATVILQIPDTHLEQTRRKWQTFLSAALSIVSPSSQTQKLAENCWLIALEVDTDFFASIVSEAKKFDIAFYAAYSSAKPIVFSSKSAP